MSDTTSQAQEIILGRIYATFTLPTGDKLNIRRLPMKKEVLFVNIYNDFVKALTGLQGKFVEQLSQLSSGKKTSFSLQDAASSIGDVLAKMPEFQSYLSECLQIVLEASGVKRTSSEIQDQLATADVMEILAKQAEVQGILASFRLIVAGLSASGLQS